MCGIFGYSTAEDGLTVAEKAILAAALGHENDSRGGDSWGVYAFNGKSHLIKGLGKIRGGFRFPDVHDCSVVMAHTRKATTGAITWDNAHPFRMGPIVGAHNGYVLNHDEMNKKYGREFKVDSMHIFAHLAERKELKELHGWGAIEWSNMRNPKKIRLCRLDGGQLSVYGICRTPAEAKTEGVRQNTTIAICWSSSDWHLKDSLALAGLSERAFSFEVDMGRVFMVDAGRYSFDGTRTLAFGEEHYGARNSSHFCGNDFRSEYWKNQSPYSGHKSSETSTAGFKHNFIPRYTKRIGRFAIVEDAISSVYVDPVVVREFFEAPAMITVAPITEDDPTEEQILPAGETDEAKKASDVIVKELEADALAMMQDYGGS